MAFHPNKKSEVSAILSQTFFNLDNLLDEDTGYIFLDTLWIKADTFKKTFDLIRKSLSNVEVFNQSTTIMAADKLKFPFGVIPLASAISLSERKDLLIWKEQGDFLTGMPLVYGDGMQDITNVVIFHDVFFGGYSIIKMIESLSHIEKKHNRKCETINICSLVNLGNEQIIKRTIKNIYTRTKKEIKTDNFINMLDLSSHWDWKEEGA